jgi:hypothetical protein
MEHIMLNADLMEVRAESEIGAIKYAEDISGRIVERVLYVAAGIYQVALR